MTKTSPGALGPCLTASLTAALLFVAVPAHPQESDDSPEYGEWGIDLAAMDRSIDPGDDFYRYVSGKWLETTTIPAGYPQWKALASLARKTDGQVDAIMTELLAKDLQAGSSEQQIADFYRSYMNVDNRNRLGIEPLRGLIDGYMKISTRDELYRAMGMPDSSSPIGFGVLADPGNPERQLLHVGQGGLTMPDPVYYLGEGDQFDAVRGAFLDYAENIFQTGGFTDARARAEQLLALEMQIAAKHWPAEQTRDRVRMYHPMSTAELAAYAPGVDWSILLNSLGAGDVTEVNVTSDTAIRDLSALVAETPVETWRAYLVFHLINDYAEYLTDDLNAAQFAFHGTALAGVDTQRPLQERAISNTGALLGEPVGRLYAERYFPEDYKETVNTMIEYLVAEYRERFRTNEWMDDATRAEALAKLDLVVSHIGYPDRYHDYSSIRITPDDLVGNVRRRLAWSHADSIASLKEPTRKWEWPFNPQEVNAGYVPSLNSITFPAGILQPPFFNPDADIAVNFGSIGAVIGHELGHGFDDQGKTYDGTGKIRNWWTDEAEARFRERTAKLVAQFNEYSPIEGENVNGALTLGENIGDLGGLTVGYAAYRRYVDEQQGGEAPVIGGFTGDQRFFLSWAQLWRNLSTPAETRRRLVVDVHSPGEFRANGAVRNVDGWYDAFDVEPGEDLYLPPEERVHIW